MKIAKRFKLNENCLDNVICARASNSKELTQLLIKAAELMSKSTFTLLIVDNAMRLFR